MFLYRKKILRVANRDDAIWKSWYRRKTFCIKERKTMKQRKRILAAAVALSLMVGSISLPNLMAAAAVQQTTSIVNLKTNNLTNPKGIDDTTPSFSWQMDSNLIGQSQEAYQLVVSRASDGKVMWDSERQADSKSTYIEYGSSGSAEPLEKETEYIWQVKVWDASGNILQSAPAVFSLGLLDTEDWGGAKWIGLDYNQLDLGVKSYSVESDVKLSTEKYTSIIFGAKDQIRYFYMKLQRSGDNITLMPMVEYGQKAPTFGENQTQLIDPANQSNPDESSKVDITSLVSDAQEYFHIKVDVDAEANCLTVLINGQQALSITNPLAYSKEDGVKDGIQLSYGKVGLRQQKSDTFGDSYNYFDNFKVIADGTEKYTYDFENGYTPFNAHVMNEVDEEPTMVVDDHGGKALELQSCIGSYPMIVLQDNFDEGLSAPMVRKTFSTESGKGEIVNATIYSTALGWYNLTINDEEVGSDNTEGNPYYEDKVYDDFKVDASDYRDTTFYQTYDVTDYIQNGDNVIGAQLGNGWYIGGITRSTYGGLDPYFMAKLVITYENGEQEIVTDASWQGCDDGPYLFNDLWDGEVYDQGKEISYSDDTADWQEVDLHEDDVQIMAQIGDPVRIINEITEEPGDYGIQGIKDISDTSKVGQNREDGTYFLYDFQQNMVGRVRATITGEPGTKVIIRHGEMINDAVSVENSTSDNAENTIYTLNLRSAKSMDVVFIGEDGTIDYAPELTFHGFRYAEITADSSITIESIKGEVISSDLETTGNITTNNADINRFFLNALWGQWGNYLSQPTDCPQRDERFGYTGDSVAFIGSGVYNTDTTAFMTRFMQQQKDWQAEDGSLPMSFPGDGSFTNIWSDSAVILPWVTYKQSGDLSILKDYYDVMYNYADGLEGKTVSTGEGMRKTTTGTLGDWLNPMQNASPGYSGVTAKSTTFAQVYTAYVFDCMSKAAEAVGNQEDAERFSTVYKELCENFKANFVITVDGRLQLTDHAMGAYAVALQVINFSDEERSQLSDAMVETIQTEDYHTTTGFASSGWIGTTLSQTGQSETAYKMITETSYPSWLYPVKNGATTIWERWNSYTVESGFHTDPMNSFNHYSLGSIVEWMYRNMAGIEANYNDIGFQNFILQPSIDVNGAIYQVNGSYKSVYGQIESCWESSLNHKTSKYELTSYSAVVPANTTATLYLPVSEEIADTFTSVSGVRFVGMTEHNSETVAQFELKSGAYDFTVKEGTLEVSIADGYITSSNTDKSILNQVIDYAEAQRADESFATVIESVQASFVAALDNAKQVALDTTVDQNTVDKAWIDLMKEIHKLGFVQGDKTSLATLIQTGEIYEASIDNYVDAGKAEFLAALKEARNTYADGDAMEGDVKAASEELLNRMMELRLKADKNLLLQAIAAADEIDTATYTEETVMAFNAAKSEAKGIYENENATQEEVNTATDKLTEAINGLVLKSLEDAETVTVAGDQTLTTKKGNAKTGETTAPIAMVTALLVLAGAAFVHSRKRK